MNGCTPHIVQYQGSKRLLAPQILPFMPKRFDRLIEPFSGMAAISVATAQERKAGNYCINDINAPIVNLLQMAIEHPEQLIKSYTRIWKEQFDFTEGHVQHFYHIRKQFNLGEQTAANMLYLLARCVKGAVRYGKNGNFNQSPDKRRHGTNPQNIAANIQAVSALLRGKAAFSALDYHEMIDMAKPGDLVYMAPPYQGVSDVKDHRYIFGVAFEEFVASLEILNRKQVDYIVSYDGECGGKAYGEDLPAALDCKKILLNAGVSTQATLLGKRHTTFEALYVSQKLSAEVVI